MSVPFVGVPVVAIAECATPGDLALVLRLYERGDRFRWQAFVWTLSEMVKDSGLRRESVLVLLRRLEARGLIVRDPGDKQHPGRITVHSASHVAAVSGPRLVDPTDHGPDHAADHGMSPKSGSEPAVSVTELEERTTDRTTTRTTAPEVSGPPRARVEDTRARQTRPDLSTETDHTPEKNETEETRANAGESAVFARERNRPIRKTQEEAWQVQRCVALAGMSIVSGMSTMPPETAERIVAAVRSGWTDEDFDLVWQWSTNSGDRMAELARESIGAARWSWLLAKQRENRRTAAKEWDRRGRTDTPSAARSPPRGDAGRVSVMSILFDNAGDP